MKVSSNSNGVFQISAVMPSFGPADSTTYYFGNIYTTTNPLTVATLRQCGMPFNCVLVAAEITSNSSTVGVTQENNTIAVRINDTTDVTLSSAVQFQNNVFNHYNITGLNTTFAAGDKWEIKWTTPAFATNPTNAVLVVMLYFKPL